MGSPAPNSALNLKRHVPGELSNLRFEEPLLKWTGELTPDDHFFGGPDNNTRAESSSDASGWGEDEVPIKVELHLPVVGAAQERGGSLAGLAAAGGREASGKETD